MQADVWAGPVPLGTKLEKHELVLDQNQLRVVGMGQNHPPLWARFHGAYLFSCSYLHRYSPVSCS